MRLLTRHFGYRKLLFTLAAWPVSGIALFVFGRTPPADYGMWPEQARASVALLSSGLWGAAVIAWTALLLRPLSGIHEQAKMVLQIIFGFVVVIFGLPSAWKCLQGISFAAQGGQQAVVHIGGAVFWAALLPIVIASLVAVWPDASERIRSIPAIRRQFIAGQGHTSGFATAPTISAAVRPIKDTSTPSAGKLSESIFAGETMFESSYVGGKSVFINETSHMVTCAMTGAGKLISSIGPTACMYQGSAVFISPKPELADMFAGRRVDPRILDGVKKAFSNRGVDPRRFSKTKYHIPGSRSFILDPSQQGVYPSSRHTILSEIDLNDDNARSLIFCVATGIKPDNPRVNDPFWNNATRGLVAGVIGDTLTRSADPQTHTLPYVVDRLMGIDPKTGQADPTVFQDMLISMLSNNALGGLIQQGASTIMQLGDRAFGSINAEVGNATRWITDPMMRRHLSGPSDFSYTELGDDQYPVTVFLVPPRAAFQEALPFLRVHSELGLQLSVLKRQRPSIPTLFLCDEFRQYGDSIRAIRDGATILRDARVKLWLFTQSWPSLVDTIGEDGANELSSCSAVQYFGVNDVPTAERISRELGRYTIREGGRLRRTPTRENIYDVVTPAEVMQELRKTSSLQYVFPATSAPMKLVRTSFKPIVTAEGARFPVLPLDGHYDDHSRFTVG